MNNNRRKRSFLEARSRLRAPADGNEATLIPISLVLSVCGRTTQPEAKVDHTHDPARRSVASLKRARVPASSGRNVAIVVAVGRLRCCLALVRMAAAARSQRRVCVTPLHQIINMDRLGVGQPETN